MSTDIELGQKNDYQKPQGDEQEEVSGFSAQPKKTMIGRLWLILYFARRHSRILFGVLAFLIVLLILMGYSFIPRDLNAPIKEVQQYYYQVYCPMNEIIKRKNFNQFVEDMHLNQAQSDFLKRLERFIKDDSDAGIDKYVVWIEAREPKQGNIDIKQNYTLLYYCGYVREWHEDDCSNPKPICSIPGPLFYIQKNQKVDVAWVYNIKSQNAQKLQYFDDFSNCYFSNLTEKQCSIKAKYSSSKPGSVCTFADPTEIQKNLTITIQSSVKTVPTTTHIHGLEVRPTFDGNPMSSMNMQSQFGVGYQSMLYSEYYSLFNQYEPTPFVVAAPEDQYLRINRYHNFQPPGNLWYHDHAMHATYDNVNLGLAGGYIIYDKNVDSHLPTKENEIIIIIARGYETTNPNMTEAQKASHMKINPRGSSFKSSIPDPIFFRNQTYRFRILNGQFDAIFPDMKFVAGCPHTISGYDLQNCKYTLSLSVIGADSTVFDKPVNYISSFTLASAERIELLLVINGGGINYLPDDIRQILLISNGDDIYIRRKFKLASYKNNTLNPAIPDVIGGTPFYNLSTIPNQPCTNVAITGPKGTTSQCIFARRMRPLFRDKNFAFFINGHYHFSESGASQNPMIGTTEDWYFINTMLGPNIDHPMHVHLISFQVTQRGSLKKAVDLNDSIVCTFYEIDYYKNISFPFTSPDNLTQNCIEIRAALITNETISSLFNSAFLENKVTDPATGLYGFDVESLVTEQNTYKGSNCPDSNKYKYICEENLDIPLWYRHWKEVVTVYAGQYMKVRIRWASTDYNEDVNPYPYFKVPEDQLIEFPGFVYHCHFLQHEDNELMRPIMMQPSKFFPKEIRNQSMRACMDGKPEGWRSRSECINKLTGCA